ncbi:SH3 domain-containing protein [Clostridium sp. MCC334]|nr:SH3 domain-containing protein [Clostridium sp. MCC334]
MKERIKGRKLLRLFLVCVLGTALLSGCGGMNRYQTMELETETEAASGTEDMTVITMGETAAEEDGTEAGESSPEEAAAAEPETEKYQPVDETVVVKADLLNVRKEDRADARIYVQLKNGEKLRRIGYNEEWSQVEYDGKTAYVASDLVEVWVEETDAPEAEPQPAVDGAGAVPADASGRAAEAQAEVPWNGHTVAIDAGHQAKPNAEKEPIGPGSETMKAKMPQGGVGAVSGVKEYELTLTLAKKLEKELKARGYHTVMIRTGHDVNLSNSQRSAMANDSEAEIFIRLHANSMENSSVYGALGMCMTAQNPYNAELHDQSYRLAKSIIDNICAQTGTKNRGVQEVDNSGEINWSQIPVAVVEAGFLSNPDEDRWLQDESYQDKLVAGIAAAVDSYFGGAAE